jgi:hypothetical protein
LPRAVVDKPRRKRATFLQWCVVGGVAAVCGAILYRQVCAAWYGGHIPTWYAAWLNFQQQHGFPEWFPF